MAAELDDSATVVILLPDSGRSYLSKYHNDDWLRRFGYLDDDGDDLVAGALAARRHGRTEAGSPTVIPASATVAQAARLVGTTESRIGPIPIVLPRPPGPLSTAISEVLGTITADELYVAASTDSAGRPVLDLASGFQFVGTGEPRTAALARLDEWGGDGLLVVRDGRLAGAVRRCDLLVRSAAETAVHRTIVGAAPG